MAQRSSEEQKCRNIEQSGKGQSSRLCRLGVCEAGLREQDAYSGLLPGWQHHFKITMLRIVSFGLDYHWRSSGHASTPAATSVSTASEVSCLPRDHRFHLRARPCTMS
jgi:hypothetical protein